MPPSRFETPTRARVLEAIAAAKEKRDEWRKTARETLRNTNGATGETNQMRRNLRKAIDQEEKEWKTSIRQPSALKQMLETREPSFFTPLPLPAASAAGETVSVEIDVDFEGAPAKRRVHCGRAYHYVTGDIVYLE